MSNTIASNYETIDCDSTKKDINYEEVWNSLKDEDILSIEIGDNRLEAEHLCESSLEVCFHSVGIKFKNGESYSSFHPCFQRYRNKVDFNRLTEEQKEHVSRKRNIYGDYGSLYTPDEDDS